MKKVLLLCASALLLFTTSCEEVMDALSESTVFTFSGTTVLDGQTANLGTTGNCKVGWDVAQSSLQYVMLNYDENGKNCVAYFHLTGQHDEEKQVVVEITTSNLDDETKEPYTGEITITPWRLMAYKKSGSSWNEVGTTISYATNGAGTYKAQMENWDGKKWVSVSSIMYSLVKTHKVYWDSTDQGTSGITLNTTGFSSKYSVEFEVTAAPTFTGAAVYLSLGPDRDEDGETLPNSTNVTNTANYVTHKISLTK